MYKFINSRNTLKTFAMLLVTAGFFAATAANRVPAFLIIFAFGLVNVLLYRFFMLFIKALSWYGLRVKSVRRLSIYLTCMSALLLALSSLGALGMRELVVIFPLALAAYIYSFYSKKERSF